MNYVKLDFVILEQTNVKHFRLNDNQYIYLEMDQPIPEGSIRNSHRDTNPIRRKFAPKRQGDVALQLVNNCSQFGPIIRQRLDPERMKPALQKGIFYVIENEGKAEPGFLVFLPKQAPVFLQSRTKAAPPCTLRMRVSPTVSEGGGSILIATLDLIQHSLRIEDVWMWKGERIFDTQSYSKRRDTLKEFVERCWIPDARLLGGITATILNPKSIQQAFGSIPPAVHTMELIPEMAGKRRMWFSLEQTVAPAVPRMAVTVPEPIKKTPTGLQRVLAKPVDKMPDIYDIYSPNGELIGKASVQQFALSQRLRSEVSQDGIWVMVEWREEFKGYEIKKVS